jgi:hypothetical protein
VYRRIVKMDFVNFDFVNVGNLSVDTSEDASGAAAP